jgi:hypothetical protein
MTMAIELVNPLHGESIDCYIDRVKRYKYIRSSKPAHIFQRMIVFKYNARVIRNIIISLDANAKNCDIIATDTNAHFVYPNEYPKIGEPINRMPYGIYKSTFPDLHAKILNKIITQIYGYSIELQYIFNNHKNKEIEKNAPYNRELMTEYLSRMGLTGEPQDIKKHINNNFPHVVLVRERIIYKPINRELEFILFS